MRGRRLKCTYGDEEVITAGNQHHIAQAENDRLVSSEMHPEPQSVQEILCYKSKMRGRRQKCGYMFPRGLASDHDSRESSDCSFKALACSFGDTIILLLRKIIACHAPEMLGKPPEKTNTRS